MIDRLAIYSNDGLLVEKFNTDKLDSLDIQIDHTLNKSQWLAAAAVAHTTPVYFIVDGKPTYDKIKAPDLIQQQMNIIRKMRKEESLKKVMDQGIMNRLETATEFYKNLLLEINGEK